MLFNVIQRERGEGSGIELVELVESRNKLAVITN